MSAGQDGFLRTRKVSANVGTLPSGPSSLLPKLVGTLTAIGVTPWVYIGDVPDAYYAQLSGTSGACTATAHFEFGDDIPGMPFGAGANLPQNSIQPAGVGTAISLSGTGTGVGVAGVGTGMFGADASVSPLVPWKYCRGVVTAISGTGAQVQFKHVLGGS